MSKEGGGKGEGRGSRREKRVKGGGRERREGEEARD